MIENYLMTAVSFLLFLLAFISTGLFIYHFARMINEVKPNKHTFANFVPWFAPFLGGLFTYKGNEHRIKSFKYFLMMALSLLIFIIIPNGNKIF